MEELPLDHQDRYFRDLYFLNYLPISNRMPEKKKARSVEQAFSIIG